MLRYDGSGSSGGGMMTAVVAVIRVVYSCYSIVTHLISIRQQQ